MSCILSWLPDSSSIFFSCSLALIKAFGWLFMDLRIPVYYLFIAEHKLIIVLLHKYYLVIYLIYVLGHAGIT